MEYREELKFICSDYNLEILKHRLSAILPYDSHQKGTCYLIRSLYFDTCDDICFYENAGGVDNRKKYRIRTYDNSDALIHFEIKEKANGRTKKSSHSLTRVECENFMLGRHSQDPGNSPVMNQIILEESLHLLRPVVIVEYERTAFTYPAGNVRITFDRNISGSLAIQEFFSEQLPKCPIMPPCHHVLEVKYDEFLPDFIAQALELGNLNRTAYSKYFLCRKACDNLTKLIC